MANLANLPMQLDLSDPAELLAYIPYQLGFQPAQSLVFLGATTGEQGARVGLLARADLDDLLNPHMRDGLRARIRHGFRRGRTRVLLLAVYDPIFFSALDSGSPRGGTGSESGCGDTPGRAMGIGRELGWWFDHGVAVPSRTYAVSPGAWRCLVCPAPGHCPDVGNDNAGFSRTQIAAAMVLHGRTIAASRSDLVVLPERPPAGSITAEVAGGAAAIRCSRALRLDARALATAIGRWKGAIRAARAAGENGETIGLGPDQYALLALSLHDVRIRDSVIYSLCTGGELPNPRTGTDAHFARMLNGEESSPPWRITPALTLLELVTRHCPADLRAPSLTTWAWCHWWAGNGAHADVVVGLARSTDDAYSLARTLEEILLRNVPPPSLHKRSAPGR